MSAAEVGDAGGEAEGHLAPPHGGELVDLLVPQERAAELLAESGAWPSWDLTPRQLCDLELLLAGGFSPLRGFQGQADHASICERMRLADGLLWPLPILLDLPEMAARALQPGSSRLALRDPQGTLLAVLEVEEVWERDLRAEAEALYGTADPHHAGVALLFRDHPFAAAGRLLGLALPKHHDFRALRHTPAELRKDLAASGWRRVVAFQTRNPMHRAHCEIALRAQKESRAHLLLHPTVGRTRPGDLDHYTRVRCYQAVLDRFPRHLVKLSLLPYAMRMGGPREAVLHAIVRKNHGCTHFIVGRDHAGPGNDAAGQPYYPPYAAQELLAGLSAELGVEMVPFRNLAYVEELDAYAAPDEVPAGAHTLDLSGSELRRRLAAGSELPPWFTYPEVAAELARSYPPRRRQGVTIFLTGLSAAGKSTIAAVLQVRLLELGGRPVTLLDGDLVRRHLSSELGFSREHRDLNIRRIGFVAAEITKSGGIALCAPIAPYDAVRKEVRAQVGERGGFVLVHVATPIEVCEQRDRKGLYAKARAGLLPEFTGVSDPYEAPDDAELTLDASLLTPEEAAQEILLYLEREGYLGAA